MDTLLRNGGPAFPPNAGWRDNDPAANGMSLRDWFATHAPDAGEETLRRVFGDYPRFDYSGYFNQTPSTDIRVRDLRAYEEWLETSRIKWRWHYADRMLAARSSNQEAER